MIETFPPVIFTGEARHLEDCLVVAAMSRAFVLQGGDCAETFKELNANTHMSHLPHPAPNGCNPHVRKPIYGVAPPSAYPSWTAPLVSHFQRCSTKCLPVSDTLREQIMSSREVQGEEGRELAAAAKTFAAVGGDRVILVYSAAT
jgi:hypothetical protein